MAKETHKETSKSDEAEGSTQQMRVIKGPEGPLPETPITPEPTRPTEPAQPAKAAQPSQLPHPAPRQSSDPDAGGVPQETVPMPVGSWTSTVVDAPAVTTARPPSNPPSLRRRVEQPSSVTRQVEALERPGLFTTELRRALPPWALPLLTFQPVSVWLGARIGLSLLALLAGLMLPSIAAKGTANWYGSPAGPLLTPFIDRVAGVWTRWDAQWYLKIATEGYRSDDGSAAFFPLYPWILRVVGWLVGERFTWAGILLSSLFFLGALVLLHRLVRLDFHPEDAGRAIFYTAAFPMSFFFWAIYSESLFLFLAVATLLLARTHRWWWAAFAVACAIWTRTAGLLLILPLAWEMWRAYHPPMPTNPNVMPPARPHRWSLASLVLPVLSLVGLLLWANMRFGDPLAEIKAQTGWNRQFSWPWATVGNAIKEAVQMPFAYQPENQSWTYLGALVFALIVGVLALRWLRGSYSLYLWAGILFPLFSATPHNPLLSYSRFLIVLFPIFMVLALMGRNRYANQVITWSSILLLALYTIRFANWFWVA
ncbi:MAG: hypothetical protein M3014_08735 [Chloroflexota bacterium]|nr:hypothetical protein [Chloroflexota bacterium]